MTITAPITYTRTRASITGTCSHNGRTYSAKDKSRNRVASKLARKIKRAKEEDAA